MAKLASISLQRSQQSGLQAPSFSSGIEVSINPGRINPNAAAITYTPTPAPQITYDETLPAAAQFAQVWVDAAFRHEEQVATAKADTLALQFDTKGSELLAEYLNTTGAAANESYEPFVKSIDKLYGSLSEGQNKNVQVKLLPALSRSRWSLVEKAAPHKAKQLKVWQGQILEAQQLATRQKILEYNNEPAKMLQAIGTHATEIHLMYQDNPELAYVKQSEFINSMFEDIVNFNVDQQQFRQAGEYITTALQMGANPVLMAKLGDQIVDTAREFEERRREDENYQYKVAERQKEQLVVYAATEFLKGNPIALNAIDDAEIRSSVINMVKGASQEPPTHPEILTQIYDNWPAYVDNPSTLLKLKDVSHEDRQSLFNSAVSDSKGQNALLRTEAYRWVDSIVASPSKAYDNKVAILRNTLKNRFSEAIRRAEAEGTDISAAIQLTKNDLLKDSDFIAKEYVDIGEELLLDTRQIIPAAYDLVRLTDEKLQSAQQRTQAEQEIENARAKKESGWLTTVKPQQVALPREEILNSIPSLYQAALVELSKSFGIEPGMSIEEQIAQLNTPEKFRRYLKMIEALEIQRIHARSLLEVKRNPLDDVYNKK
jgi:hypothetical protein